MWLSCSIKNVVLKADPPCHRWVQRLVHRPRFAWELSFTTRPSPHFILMDPTYAVITRSAGCQLRGGLFFGALERCNPIILVCLHQHHMTFSKKQKNKCSLTPDCEAWKHLDAERGCLHASNKSLFLGVIRMKSVGSGSLLARGLNKQKRICKLSRCFVLQLSQSGVGLGNPGDKHLSFIGYKPEQL